jgi:hypothetical protein
MCTEQNICNVTASYISACREVGIELFMPDHCLKCNNPGTPMFTGGMTDVVDSQMAIGKQADIVFVVEEQPCMQFAKEKIDDVANKIQNTLRGFNVRYGLIGYNGVGVHNQPHLHTGDHQINFDKNGLRKAIAELVSDVDVDSDSERDPLEAVSYAATDYGFRPRAMKTIVLWTCKQCGAQYDYYDTQSELLQRGIQLHVMTTERIEIDQPHNAELMGFDASKMFTTNGEKTDLRQSLVAPHDACTVLAQETAGTVWTVADQQSSVFSVPSETMGKCLKTKHNARSCLTCECDSFELAPRQVCYPCDVPTPVSLSSGPSFFNVPYIKLRNTFRKAQKTLGRFDAWLI